MTYDVTFGSAFRSDQFGFIGKGTLAVYHNQVIISGKKSGSFLIKLAVFLLITIVPYIAFEIGLGWLFALIIIKIFCASKASIILECKTLSEIKQKGKTITFKAKHPKSGKIKKTIFKAKTEELSKQIISELSTLKCV